MTRGRAVTISLNFVESDDGLWEPEWGMGVSLSGFRMGDNLCGIDIRQKSNGPSRNQDGRPAPEWYKIAGCFGPKDADGDSFAFFQNYEQFGFEGPATKIERAFGSRAVGSGYEIIHHVLTASLSLKGWDELSKERVFDSTGGLIWAPLRKYIVFFLERRLAFQLSENSSYVFDDDGQDYIQYSARAIAPDAI